MKLNKHFFLLFLATILCPLQRANAMRITIKHPNGKFSPTMAHLGSSHLGGALWLIEDSWVNCVEFVFTDKNLSDMFSRFLDKEIELNMNGFYTFVHGQRSSLYFPSKLYTHLWSIRKKRSVQNFLFPHVKNLAETETAKNEEKIIRNFLRTQGSIEYETRMHILFMNYALFANSFNNPGSATLYWMLSNENSPTGQTIGITAHDPFTILGYEAIYEKYKTEIEQLAHDYATFSKYGNLLLIAIPKEKINKYAYVAKPGGKRISMRIAQVGETSDLQIIMETLINNPQNIIGPSWFEFCLIMTQEKGGLDPSTGIQVHPIFSGNFEKLKELQQREEALLTKIKADIERPEQNELAFNRATTIARHIIESAQLDRERKFAEKYAIEKSKGLAP